MSHFSLAVILKDDESVYLDDVLDKFDEEKEVDRYVRYTKEGATSKSKELIKGNLERYKKQLAEEEVKEEPDEDWIKRLKELIDYCQPMVDNYTDEDYYNYIAEDYSEDMIDNEGNIYSTYNPDSKWDWWGIGGRWNNLLTLKREKENDPIVHTNVAKIKDIDFDYTNPEKIKYNEMLWEKIVEGKHQDNRELFSIYDKEYLLNRYETKENFVKSVTRFRTYAILTPDGVWHEPGQMGWFGVSGATEDDEKAFDENYFNILDTEKYKDYLLVVVDCHI